MKIIDELGEGGREGGREVLNKGLMTFFFPMYFSSSQSHIIPQKILKSNPPWVAKKGAKTRDSTAMSLIRMLSDGPEVSFNGSPMVSPITAALCGSDPFGPSSLACSEAPA